MSELQELLTRGVANIIPNREELEKKLSSEEKLNIYLGIDPTAPNIHLGHGVLLRKLQKFAELGHKVTFLVGDFTAKIGDTSDKETERPQLTSEQIQKNLETYEKQASKIINFEKIQIKFNSEWLDRLSFKEGLELISKFSLNDFISRELIKKRLNEGKSVGLLETIYPVMQGYDSMILDTDLQIGGTDQTFNMQAGRALLKNQKESFVMATEFLSGTDGRKMSKTWGNAIWLTDSPGEMYKKILRLNDNVIVEYFKLATDVSNEKVENVSKRLADGENPMNIKKELARIITEEIWGTEPSKAAEKDFEKIVQRGETPDDIKTIKATDFQKLQDLAVENNLVSGTSDWKRIVEQNGASYNGVVINNPTISISELENNGILKIGKRIFVKIVKD